MALPALNDDTKSDIYASALESLISSAGTVPGAEENKEKQDFLELLQQKQEKVMDLVLDKKTILYPKEELLDKYDDLYTLLDERLSGSFVGEKDKEGAEGKPESGTATPSSITEPPAAPEGGGAGDITSTLLNAAGTAATAEAGSAAVGGGGFLGALGTGALAIGVSAALLSPIAGALGYQAYRDESLRAAPPPDNVVKLKDDPKYAHLYKLAEGYKVDQYLPNFLEAQQDEAIDGLREYVQQFIPPDEEEQFLKIWDDKVAKAGDDKKEILRASKDVVDGYIIARSQQIDAGTYEGWTTVEADTKAKNAYFEAQDAAQLAAEDADRKGRNQMALESRARTVASSGVPGLSTTGKAPTAYKGDIGRYKLDIKKAREGSEAALGRLEKAGITIKDGEVSIIPGRDPYGTGESMIATPAGAAAAEAKPGNEVMVNASAEQAAAAAAPQAPVIINSGGGGGGRVVPVPQPTPSIGGASSATPNGSSNRFDDKIMGTRADHLP